MNEEVALTKFDQARRALAEARSIDEVKLVRDQAEALRLYVRQQGESLQMQNDMAEIKLRAERRAGELLAEMVEMGQRDAGQGGDRKSGFHDETVTLGDLGISKSQSHRWQTEAAIPEAMFEAHIAETKGDGKELTSTGVYRLARKLEREAIREQNQELVEQALPLSTMEGRQFQTIVLDPPWDWGDEGDVNQFGRARPTYATMSFEEILALPVSDLAQGDAHIYLWITNRSLPKGFMLLDAWGFRYITALTWCKLSFGMGNYFRGQTEHILFGVRGSLALLRKDVGTWFQAPRPGQHSGKPDAFYELVEQCSPGPWLDMFARQERPGWASWGAEVGQ